MWLRFYKEKSGMEKTTAKLTNWRMKVGNKVGINKSERLASPAGRERGSSQLVGPGDSFHGRKRYFTTSQLMARWGVSAPTVIRLIEEGQLRGLKIRGAYRVDKESIESYEKKVAF